MKKILFAVSVLLASVSSAFADGIDFSGNNPYYAAAEFVSAEPGAGFRFDFGKDVGTVTTSSGTKIKLSVEGAYSTVNISVPSAATAGDSVQLAGVIAIPFDSKIDWLIRPSLSYDISGLSGISQVGKNQTSSNLWSGAPISVGFGYKLSDTAELRALVDTGSFVAALGAATIGMRVSF